GNLSLSNSILWANADGTETGQLSSAAPVTLVRNGIQGWSGTLGGTRNFGFDPAFQDMYGIDGVLGTEDDNLRLEPHSPYIDAGDNSWIPMDVGDLDNDLITNEPLPVDLDGMPRFIDSVQVTDTGNGTAPLVDLGAY